MVDSQILEISKNKVRNLLLFGLLIGVGRGVCYVGLVKVIALEVNTLNTSPFLLFNYF